MTTVEECKKQVEHTRKEVTKLFGALLTDLGFSSITGKEIEDDKSLNTEIKKIEKAAEVIEEILTTLGLYLGSINGIKLTDSNKNYRALTGVQKTLYLKLGTIIERAEKYRDALKDCSEEWSALRNELGIQLRNQRANVRSAENQRNRRKPETWAQWAEATVIVAAIELSLTVL